MDTEIANKPMGVLECALSNFRDKTFTLEHIQEVQQLCDNPKDCLSYLGKILGLEDYQTKAHHAFVLDYFHGINLFVVEIGFNLDQSLLVFILGKDLLCNLLGGKNFEELKEIFERNILSLRVKRLGPDSNFLFSPIDLRGLTKFFVFTLFQHYALYKACITKSCCIEHRKEVVQIETVLIPPLSEASTKEELDAQELVARAALEAEKKSKQEALEKAEAERVAATKALCIDENKYTPPTLEESVEFIVRAKLENFKKSFFQGCISQQKALLEKLEQLEVIAGATGDSKL